jgi:uncharacterized glyoxalase superfamily protein PhnB
MPTDPARPGSTAVSTLRYRDVAAAIDWLGNAFGFEKHLVVSGDSGAVRYAELAFGNGMIMLGPVEDAGLDKFMTQPADTGGAETQICYVFVADAVAHCARAKAAGAEIVLDIEDADSNGRGYSCRDLEGHVWNFGTYDPHKRRSALAPRAGRKKSVRLGLRWPARAASLMVAALACAVVLHWDSGTIDLYRFELAADTPFKSPNEGLVRAERVAENIQQELAREREARAAAERLVRSIQVQLEQVRAVREAAERTAADIERNERNAGAARQQLARERSAVEDERRTAQQTQERLSEVESNSKSLQALLAVERYGRETAERAALEVQAARDKLAMEQRAKKRK